MNQPTNHVTQAESVTRAKAVEGKLRALQDAHRLAIHMVEQPFHYYSTDQKTLVDLNAVPADTINASLKNNQPSTFSMSVLPCRTSGFSMHPYQVVRADLHDITSGANNYGYLFDLSQSQPHPPRVTLVDTKSLGSGDKRTKKKLDLISTYHNEHLPRLAGIYGPYDKNGQWQENWIRALGGKDGSKLTELQLDALGSFYVNKKSQVKQIGKNVAEYNEATVAASTEHITAIVIPSFSSSHDYTASQNIDLYLARLHLQAAVVGLNHWREGIQLPVAIYHVTEPKSGSIEVLATNHEELKCLAAKSLAALGENHFKKLKPVLKQYKRGNSNDQFHQKKLDEYKSLEGCLERELSIDMGKGTLGPNAFQAAILKVSPAPSPRSGRTSPE